MNKIIKDYFKCIGLKCKGFHTKPAAAGSFQLRQVERSTGIVQYFLNLLKQKNLQNA